MATSRSAWKGRERQVARLFGAERQPGSGSMGRADQTRSDSTHPTLFISSKLRVSHAAQSLYDEELPKARKEGKVVLLSLATKRRKGSLLCIHSDDIDAFIEAIFDGWRPTEEEGEAA